MKSKQQYIDAVFEIAQRHDHRIEINRDGLRQIVFTNNKGNKKLHEGHLAQLYPAILQPGANIPSLINAVASGRTCVHVGMREIIKEIMNE